MFGSPYQDEQHVCDRGGSYRGQLATEKTSGPRRSPWRFLRLTASTGMRILMQRWRARNVGAVIGAVLAAIVLLALSPAARSQPAGPAADPAASRPKQNASNTNAVSAPATSSDAATNPAGNAGQQPSPQQPNTVPPDTSQLSASQSQKARLAVNPVTGLTTVAASNFTALTGKERLKLYWTQDFFSAGAYFKPTLFALVLDQATNSPSQWGGGFRGFGLREASRIGGNIVSGTIRAPLAAALHEDVRYISNEHGGRRRLLHAVEYSFLTYNNQGHPTLNIAKFVSYYASTAISTTWHPAKHSVVGYTFANGSEQLGLSVPFNVLQEFWPDIFHKRARGQRGP